MAKYRIDLNADLGEAADARSQTAELELLRWVGSVNVACGYHAGDAMTMERMVTKAAEHGVAVGAHPSFPDRSGFGRRQMLLHPREIEADMLYQIGALHAFCVQKGVSLEHVKAHGALYLLAWKDQTIADAIARAVYAFSPKLMLYAPAGSAQEAAAASLSLRVVREAFIDRRYQADGTLLDRSQPGSVLESDEDVIEQALDIVLHGRVRTASGTYMEIKAETLCLHGDHPGALERIQRLHKELLQAGVELGLPRVESRREAR